MISFSIFTTRSREISTRLRFLARGFQLSGIAAWTVTAVGTAILSFARQPVHMYRWMFPPLLLYGVLAGTSMYLIGRALLQRQRWGAYLAGITLGAPLIKQLVLPDAAILSISGIVVTTLALGAIVTVWDELGTVREAECIDPDTEEDDQLAKRNRGFGEPRTLPMQSVTDVQLKSSNSAPDRAPVEIEPGS